MAANRAPLEPQAKAALKRMAGFEEIDRLMPKSSTTPKHTDYFFKSRSVIVEQKEITKYKWLKKGDLRDFNREMVVKYGADPKTHGLRIEAMTQDEF